MLKGKSFGRHVPGGRLVERARDEGESGTELRELEVSRLVKAALEAPKLVEAAMSILPARILAALAVVGLVSLPMACSSTPEPVPTPEVAEAPGLCEVVPQVAATRIVVPSQPTCTREAAAAADEACASGHDPLICYAAGFCLSGMWLGVPAGDAGRDAALAKIQTVLGESCVAGVAEACTLRAGVAIETGTPAADTCGDVVRGCHLGDDAGACLSCMATDCDVG